MSYQILYTWVKKVKEMGEVGLEDYRGKPIGLQTPRTEEERPRQENARLLEDKKDLMAEIALLKKDGDRGKVAFLEGFSLTHLLRDFKAIKEVHEETNISIESFCRLSKVSRATYYGWLNHIKSVRELLREKVAQEVVKIHQKYPDIGYRRIVSYVIGDRNNTALAFETMEKSLKENPGAHPMIHTDRGFRYTSNRFHKIVEKAWLVHSMSRVGCCADNGLMEGFRGMLKRER